MISVYRAIIHIMSHTVHVQLAGVEGLMDGKLHVCSSGEGGTDGKDLPVCMYMYVWLYP